MFWYGIIVKGKTADSKQVTAASWLNWEDTWFSEIRDRRYEETLIAYNLTDYIVD